MEKKVFLNIVSIISEEIERGMRNLENEIVYCWENILFILFKKDKINLKFRY